MIYGEQWVCDHCGTHNFFLRKVCRECRLVRSMGPETPLGDDYEKIGPLVWDALDERVTQINPVPKEHTRRIENFLVFKLLRNFPDWKEKRIRPHVRSWVRSSLAEK
jgi:hypothetical protein